MGFIIVVLLLSIVLAVAACLSSTEYRAKNQNKNNYTKKNDSAQPRNKYSNAVKRKNPWESNEIGWHDPDDDDEYEEFDGFNNEEYGQVPKGMNEDDFRNNNDWDD